MQSLTTRKAVKTCLHIVDHAGVESAYGAFPLKCARACVRHLRLLAESSTETITLIVPRQSELKSLNIWELYNYLCCGKVVLGNCLVGEMSFGEMS